ncbi:hypothetical protein DUI87_08360 [Hirundo rustica rustica]|uniref:Uncharacterized protein n=1 Tax=Hirundo rustica rustica TaxID=333673 RepID=A0A3M0KTA9_HIRRU|nr:hypothetical protein DUI87_08360 [Hirundo rustica rustica]
MLEQGVPRLPSAAIEHLQVRAAVCKLAATSPLEDCHEYVQDVADQKEESRSELRNRKEDYNTSSGVKIFLYPLHRVPTPVLAPLWIVQTTVGFDTYCSEMLLLLTSILGGKIFIVMGNMVHTNSETILSCILGGVFLSHLLAKAFPSGGQASRNGRNYHTVHLWYSDPAAKFLAETNSPQSLCADNQSWPILVLLSSPSMQLSQNRAKCKGASEAQAVGDLLPSLLKVSQETSPQAWSFPPHQHYFPKLLMNILDFEQAFSPGYLMYFHFDFYPVKC